MLATPSLEIILSSALAGWLVGDGIVAAYHKIRTSRDAYVPLVGPFTYVLKKVLELRL